MLEKTDICSIRAVLSRNLWL